MDEPSQPTTIPSYALFDLVVIGSGPSSLSLVARLLERRPAALYTEEEHAHLSWLHRHTTSTTSHGASQPSLIRTRKGGKKGNVRLVVLETQRGGERRQAPNGVERILVADRLGGWMKAWDNAFKAFDIRYLRSPLFWHPCPADRDGLLAFATLNGRAQVIEPCDFVSAMQKGQAKVLKPSVKVRRRAKRDRLNTRRGSDDSVTSSDSVGSGVSSSATSLTSCSSCENSSPPPSLSAGLLEIAGCVGKEMSKHKKRVKAASRGGHALSSSLGTDVNERDRKDYHAAATGLFRDFVQRDVVQRYGLEGEGAWQPAGVAKERWEREEDGQLPEYCRSDPRASVDTVKSSVQSLRWTELLPEGTADESFKGFAVQLDDGVLIGAKSVVLAVGPSGGRVNVPDVIRGTTKAAEPAKAREEGDASSPPPPPVAPLPLTHGPGWAHTAALASPSFAFPSPPPNFSGRASTLIVIGGGLTSAQICDLGVRRGFQKVLLLLRGHMKVKPFDVGLEWLGRYSNIKKMQFWQEELASSRLSMIRSARQGGSITPVYAEILRSHVAAGRLEIREHTSLTRASYDEAEEKWSLELRNKGPSSGVDLDEVDAQTESLKASYIVSATGAAPSILDLPLMAPVKTSHPIPTEGGLPLITEDLQWRADLPLFVVGGFASLQIGPGAGNLGGMQEAADRVALKLTELFASAVASSSQGGSSPLSLADVLPSSEEGDDALPTGPGSARKEAGAKVPRHRGSPSKAESKAPQGSSQKDLAASKLKSTLALGPPSSSRATILDEGYEEEEEDGISDAYARSDFPHFGFHALTVEG